MNTSLLKACSSIGDIFYLCHVIGERIEVMPMIGIDWHSAYNFGYPLFLSLPDLMTEINSFDDLNKNRHFLKQTAHYLN